MTQMRPRKRLSRGDIQTWAAHPPHGLVSTVHLPRGASQEEAQDPLSTYGCCSVIWGPE